MEDESVPGTNALGLDWVFSFNEKAIGGVHSLCTDQRSALFYIAAHTGVIYDFASRTQQLLQGHRNPISCAAVSKDKRWIVTADSGPEPILVVWDSYSGSPVKTIFKPHQLGVVALDISADSLYIVTLSKAPQGTKQEIGIWEWTEGGKEEASHLEPIPSRHFQTCIKFNSGDSHELMTNGASQVLFWTWNESSVTLYSPRASKKESYHHAGGHFTVSSFVEGTTLAITGTADGKVLMWDVPYLASSSKNQEGLPQKAFVKSIQLSSGSINHLSSVKKFICVSGEDGAVRFYDYQFRIEGWFEDLNAGPITSVSFAASSYTDEATTGSFYVPDFVIGTEKGYIVAAEASFFEEIDAENRRGTLLVQGLNDEIHGIACHPTSDRLAMTCSHGSVHLWDYDRKLLLNLRIFDKPKLCPCIAIFDPSGQFLALGFINGTVKCLNAETLEDIMTAETSQSPIKYIKTSSDGHFLAFADADRYVSLWVHRKLDAQTTAATVAGNLEPTSSSSPSKQKKATNDKSWQYIGRNKSHNIRITGLEFVRRNNGREALVSVGGDRKLVEYDLENSSIENGLIILGGTAHKMEQFAKLTSCMWYPNLEEGVEDKIITANTEFKLKQWNADTFSCRSTSLAPSFGGPITTMISIPSSLGSSKPSGYLAYATASQIIGLIKLPLDGNPDKSMGLIAHPTQVASIAISRDGKFLFSSGGKDRTVNQWIIQTSALDAQAASSNTEQENDLGPYLRLLEGEEEGPLHQEMKDYFIYAQLRLQGESTTDARIATQFLPVEEIPAMMRAMGYFPTKAEITNMIEEVRLKDYTKTGEVAQTIDQENLIKLYINHRPTIPLDKRDIEKAFDAVQAGSFIYYDSSSNDTTKLGTQRLLYALETRGEHLGSEEMIENLLSLTGEGTIHTAKLTPVGFATEILGFEEVVEKETSVGQAD